MKKWFIGVTIAVLMVTCSFSINAAPGGGHDNYNGGHDKYYGGPNKHGYQERDDSYYVIHRSADILQDAQRYADRGHRFGNLSLAFAHQQRAREFYMHGSYRDAIFHSLRARDLAFDIIRANHGKIRQEYYWDGREDHWGHDSPRYQDLDVRIDRSKIGRDSDVVHMHFDFDVRP